MEDKMKEKMEKNKKFSNIIRVADKKIYFYEHAILLSMSPEVYDEYGEIKIQVTVSNLNTAELLIKLFKNAGLYEFDRIKKPIEVKSTNGEPYVLENAYEIILKKIPALLHI